MKESGSLKVSKTSLEDRREPISAYDSMSLVEAGGS